MCFAGYIDGLVQDCSISIAGDTAVLHLAMIAINMFIGISTIPAHFDLFNIW